MSEDRLSLSAVKLLNELTVVKPCRPVFKDNFSFKDFLK